MATCSELLYETAMSAAVLATVVATSAAVAARQRLALMQLLESPHIRSATKSIPWDFCRFLINRQKFQHEILHIYSTFPSTFLYKIKFD